MPALEKETMEDCLRVLDGELWKVDRLPADRNEGCRPQGAKDHWAHERESVEPGVAGSNFASFLCVRDETGDRSDRLRGESGPSDQHLNWQARLGRRGLPSSRRRRAETSETHDERDA